MLQDIKRSHSVRLDAKDVAIYGVNVHVEMLCLRNIVVVIGLGRCATLLSKKHHWPQDPKRVLQGIKRSCSVKLDAEDVAMYGGSVHVEMLCLRNIVVVIGLERCDTLLGKKHCHRTQKECYKASNALVPLGWMQKM